MGLLDSLYKQNYKYINALDALDMLAQHERCDISEIAKFLLANEYHKDSETYKKIISIKLNLVMIKLLDLFL